MTTSSVRTLVLLPWKGVAVAVTRHCSGVSLMAMKASSRHTQQKPGYGSADALKEPLP